MPPSIQDRLRLLGCGLACIGASVPVTLFIPLPLTMAFTRRFKREDRLRRLHRMTGWARFCRKHIFRIDLSVEGQHLLPPVTRGHMFVSNHQSWVDIVVLMEALSTVAFLSKRLVRYIPMIGRSAYAGGTIFVDRKHPDSRQRALKETLRMCAESTAVVVFPEGTRSASGQLREKIHPGAIRAGYEHGLSVIPVALDGTFRVLPKSMDQVHMGQRVAVTIGEVISPTAAPDADAWVEMVWRRVTDLFHHSRARLG